MTPLERIDCPYCQFYVQLLDPVVAGEPVARDAVDGFRLLRAHVRDHHSEAGWEWALDRLVGAR